MTSKFKIEHDAGRTFLVVQGQKGQQISEREFYAIHTGQVPGLLRAEMIRKGNSFKLVYNISGFISLREFLINPLTKQSFARMLGNILNNLKALQKAYYNQQFILMDMNAAMVNPATQQISFVYVPITFYESGTNLKEFLLSIIQCCSFAAGENTAYVREYIRILNSGMNFSVFDLEEYVKSLGMDSQKNGPKKCSRCGTPIQPNVNFCASCGMKLTGLLTDNPHAVYDPAKAAAKPKQQEPASVAVPEPAQMYCDTIARSSFVEAPQPPQQSYQPVQQPPQPPQQSYQPVQMPVETVRSSYLIRRKTGEKIRITSESFRIGKDPHNCEYCVRDNSAVSRCHAVIKSHGGVWVINDLNSTNKTYVNARAIEPYADVELHDGTSIKLANEDFIFNIT